MKPVYVYHPSEDEVEFSPDEGLVPDSVDTFEYFAFPVPEDKDTYEEVVDYLKDNTDDFADACRWREEYGLAIEHIYYLLCNETIETTEEFVCFDTHDEGVGSPFEYQCYTISVKEHGSFTECSNGNPPRNSSGPSNVVVRCSELSDWMEHIHFAYYKPTWLTSISATVDFDDCKHLSNWRSCNNCGAKPEYEDIDDFLVYSEDGLYCSDCA